MRFQYAFLVLLLCACGDDDFLPVFDAGPQPDVPVMGNDTGPVGMDAGPGEDAGPPEMDAGPPEMDAGPPEMDAGPSIPPNVMAWCDRVGPEWAEACIVDQGHVEIGDVARPAFQRLFPMNEDPWNMNGWEWWQKWPGGFSPTFEYEEASDGGVICSVASAIRFAAILENPPARLAQLRRNNTWDGRFFNWNDDFSEPGSTGTMRGTRLWAWQDHLIKWISQTNPDGSCELPTADMLESAVANCIIRGMESGGSIEGCTN